MQSGKKVITVWKAPTTVLAEAQAAKDGASAVLGYLNLIASKRLFDLAETAFTQAGSLELMATNDFLESEYRSRLNAYEAACADLKKEIAPERAK
jgi:hypothetical protein